MEYFIDAEGNYIGAFSFVSVTDESGQTELLRHPDVPEGATLVDTPPADARQRYADGAWQLLT